MSTGGRLVQPGLPGGPHSGRREGQKVLPLEDQGGLASRRLVLYRLYA